MDVLPPPSALELTGNVAENWKKFKQRFQLYISAIGVSKKVDNDNQLTSILLHVIGEPALDVYNTFKWDEEGDKEGDNMRLAKVMAKLEKYCTPKTNLTLERFHFNNCCQQPGEGIDAYLTRLKKHSKKCEFGTLQDSLVKDRLVCGIVDNVTRERLLRDEDLNLNKAVKICKAAELVKERSKELQSAAPTVNAVQKKSAKTKTKKSWNTPNDQTRQRKQQTGDKHHCRRCDNWHISGKCPAYGEICAYCKGKNHFAKCCFKKRGQSQVHTVDEEESSDFVLDSVTVDSVNTQTDDWVYPLTVNGTTIPVKLDTGAQVNILPESDYNRLRNKPQLSKATETLKAYNQSQIIVKGKCVVTVDHNARKHKMLVFVVPGNKQALLGRQACERLGLVKLACAVTKTGHSKDDNDNYANLLHDYRDVFDGLGCLPGMHTIIVDQTATPVVHACRKVPFALHNGLKKELGRMERLSVITRVEEPTDWVNSLVVVKKKNGDIRVCMDPRDLNRAIKREHYKMPTREEIMSQFAGATYYSKLDASQGFWQLQLDEESSHLCTFNTPFGRYRYLRLPFGISSAPEVYHKTIHQIFESIDGVSTIADDIIIYGATREAHDNSLQKTLEIARQVNLKLNRDKCEIGVTQLTFIGDLVTAEGVKPDPQKVTAINNMLKPESKQELQRFLGMVTYLAKWIAGFSQKSAPLRALLKEDNEWQWGPEQDRSWSDLKNAISTEPVLQYYDPNCPIRLSSDASKDGLGAVILQLHDNKWTPVAYASRAMTSAETRYAQIEKELLGIVFACERFHQFIYGATVEAETDHKPLISLFKKPLTDCPLRVQRLLLMVQKYDLLVVNTPGKQLVVADTISRAPDCNADKGETARVQSVDDVVETFVDMIIETMPVSDNRLNQIRDATQADDQLISLKRMIIQGWPEERHQCQSDVCPFWNNRAELSVAEDVIFKGTRIVIPRMLRKDVLLKIHEGHMGIEKCRRRARDTVYWPGMNAEISNMVSQCDACQKHQPSQPVEPLNPHEIPVRAWQRVGADIGTNGGKEYLIVCDYYSGYPEVVTLATTTSKAVINAIKSMFARHGVPDVVISDNGPQFGSKEFADFAKDWGFEHQTSSPHYPRSNGLAESAVKTVKQMIKKCQETKQDFHKALLAYRSTPLQNGLSPSQMLMNRRVKTTLPVHPQRLEPEVQQGVVSDKIQSRLQQKQLHDRKAHSLEPLNPQDRVRVQDFRTGLWTVRATVLRKVAPRSYEIEAEGGWILRRNRGAIRKDTVPKQTFVDPKLLEEELTLQLAKEHPEQSETQQDIATPVGSPHEQTFRRSSRTIRRPKRLIETL